MFVKLPLRARPSALTALGRLHRILKAGLQNLVPPVPQRHQTSSLSMSGAETMLFPRSISRRVLPDSGFAGAWLQAGVSGVKPSHSTPQYLVCEWVSQPITQEA